MSKTTQPTETPTAPPTPGTEIRPTASPEAQSPQPPQPQAPITPKKKSTALRVFLIVSGIIAAWAVVFMLPDQLIPFPGNHNGIVKYTEKTYEKISMPTSWQQYSKGENSDPIDIGAADTGWTYSYSIGADTDEVHNAELRHALSQNDGGYTFDTSGSPKVLVASSEKQNLKLTATFKGQSVDVEVRELHVDE